MKLSVTKQFEFEACHNLPYYDGACARLHGHSYKLEVTVSGEVNQVERHCKHGMIMDFSCLKDMVNTLIIRDHDHHNLNDLYDYPTAENMVVEIFNTLDKHFANIQGMQLERIKLWETSTSYAEYSRD